MISLHGQTTAMSILACRCLW